MLLLLSLSLSLSLKVVGHDNDDHPYCYFQNKRKWKRRTSVAFDYMDGLNALDGPHDGIDRHQCMPVDADKDGVPDLVCVVGADKGRGLGFAELYLTNKSRDRGLVKVPEHGLQKYPSMRSRMIRKFTRGADQATLIFISTNGIARRSDGLPNQHRVFRLLESGQAPYFEEVDGPWSSSYFKVECILTQDVNGDGLDDLVLCNPDGKAKIILQTRSGRFEEVDLGDLVGTENWWNARLGNVVASDGGGTRPASPLKDLVVVGKNSKRNFLKVFRSTGDARPYFDFAKPYFGKKLPHFAPE